MSPSLDLECLSAFLSDLSGHLIGSEWEIKNDIATALSIYSRSKNSASVHGQKRILITRDDDCLWIRIYWTCKLVRSQLSLDQQSRKSSGVGVKWLELIFWWITGRMRFSRMNGRDRSKEPRKRHIPRLLLLRFNGLTWGVVPSRKILISCLHSV